MCRNLTDLCLALCEGKHESPSSMVASPVTMLDVPARDMRSRRVSRTSPARTDISARSTSRPISRLESRRASILGQAAVDSLISTLNSPRFDTDGEELSASEQESTPSHVPSNKFDQQRYVRPSSRLTAPRIARYEETSGDEDPTLRAPSRVGSEFSFRSKPMLSTRDYASSQQNPPQRSVSLREAINNRRSSNGAEGHRELTRVASMSSEHGRRRWLRESTPPVLEEEAAEQQSEYGGSNKESVAPPPQPPPHKQRIVSQGLLNLVAKRNASNATLGRSTSLGRRGREVIVE